MKPDPFDTILFIVNGNKGVEMSRRLTDKRLCKDGHYRWFRILWYGRGGTLWAIFCTHCKLKYGRERRLWSNKVDYHTCQARIKELEGGK